MAAIIVPVDAISPLVLQLELEEIVALFAMKMADVDGGVLDYPAILEAAKADGYKDGKNTVSDPVLLELYNKNATVSIFVCPSLYYVLFDV